MHEETRPDWYFESPQTAEGGGDEVENEYQVFDMLQGVSQQDSSKIATNEDQNRTDWNGSIYETQNTQECTPSLTDQHVTPRLSMQNVSEKKQPDAEE